MEPTTGKAKYYTLMEALKEQILSGTIKPGQKLPSENELTLDYALGAEGSFAVPGGDVAFIFEKSEC